MLTDAEGLPEVLDTPGLSFLDASIKLDASGITLRVWSALTRRMDLERYVEREARRWAFDPHGAVDPITALGATFSEPPDGHGLPCIMITVTGSMPLRGRAIADWYDRGPWARWKQKLWDGSEDLERRKTPNDTSLIRGWTLFSLQVYAGLRSNREALHAWNSIAPAAARLEVGDGTTDDGEARASRDLRRAREAAEKLKSHLSRTWTLTDS